ncbi:hypothetical protein [Dyadobacter sp. CY356]|uniref:hypothetical protein n=1 Tax=Dyadobacter sp. CY356 TaxID=2906442 RepID=UPI001F23448F|nr:hypothetical protein [Dyadobacter sp. CY356]MCF0057096.1 hypothetical protein [Dyadobacter sp. CY356]
MNSFNILLKAGLLIALFLFPDSLIYGQPHKILRVKNGQDATKHVSSKDRFKYQDFQSGRLHYNNGKFALSRLNYCYLLGEVIFINTQGDTLALADNNQLRYAEIGNQRFYPFPENGFVEIVEDYGVIKLTKKVRYQKDGIEKKGAYENNNEIGSIYNASTFTDITGRTTILPPDNTILLKLNTSYFFMDVNNRFSKATKTNLVKIFWKNKNAVEKYLDDQNIDFSKEEDLKKVLRYCSDL